MQRVRWGLWWRYLFAVGFKYFCFSSGSLCIDVPIIIIIKKSLFQTVVVGILGIDYTFRQRNFGIYFNIQYIYTIFCISTHTSTTQIHLLRQAWLFLPDVTIFFKLKLQKLYDVWDFGSAIRSLGKRGKKKIKITTTLGSGMHHCVDDVCGDRWQLKRACSRTVVSDCWLWYSLGLLGLCCCVLFNNPNPLSPPQPTSVLWLFLVFLLHYTAI